MGVTQANIVLGGMALPDGVFIKSARAWAVARGDGSVETGTHKISRVSKIPLVRVLYSIVQGIGAAVARRRRSLGSRATKLRLLVALLSPIGVGWLMDLLWPAVPQWLGAWLLMAASLLVLRVLMPSALWRYHGAEHKAIAAFETYGHPATATEARGISRVHDRCGTNAVFLVLLFSPFVATNGLILPAVLVSAELIRWSVAKHGRSPVTRVLVSGGRFLQRTVTTVEPTTAELEVGCRAVEACVARHLELVASSPSFHTATTDG